MFHNHLDDCPSLLKAEHCNLFYLSYLVYYLRQQEVFINHNQNPAKESVKITVGRLLVVSSIAPLSQREAALMPSPGPSSHFFWPIRGKLGWPRANERTGNSLGAQPWLWRSQELTMGQNDGSEEKSWFILEVTSLTLLFYCRKLYDMERKLQAGYETFIYFFF